MKVRDIYMILETYLAKFTGTKKLKQDNDQSKEKERDEIDELEDLIKKYEELMYKS